MKKSLLPSLTSAIKGEKPASLITGFREGDLLHLTDPVAGRPKGTILPILGYCLNVTR